MAGQIANRKICYVEPEHGPWPYQQSMPNTQTKPTHDIWESNKHMAKLVKDSWPSVLEMATKKNE